MLEADDIDFEADAEALAPTADKLQSVSELVLEQLAAEGEVAVLEQQLKDAKERLRRVAEVKLPDALAEARTGEFKTDDGIKVAVKDDLAVSIPKKNKQLCNDWLRKHDLGDLIAPKVEVTLLKGQDNVAARLLSFLDAEGFSYVREDAANTGSVKAALKRKIEAGEEVPLEMFGGHLCRKAVITLPKA